MVQTPRAIAAAYWRDESARDVDAVMSHYLPDAEFVGPDGRRVGLASIREYYEASARTYPGLWVEITSDLTIGERAAIEWRAELTDTEGRHYPASGVNVIEIRGDKFISVHSYFDTRGLK